MENNTTEATAQQKSTQQQITLDAEKVAAFQSQLKSEQNLPMGLLGGVLSALIGAVIWATVTILTKYQIGWMAVGIGFLVGIVIRFLGRGVSKTFGILGAVCSLAGCLLGNLLSTCGFLSIQESMPLLEVVGKVMTQPATMVELLSATFSPMDLVFYGIAVYEGYRFSFRQISQEELSSLARSP